jgi:hypothetical protein
MFLLIINNFWKEEIQKNEFLLVILQINVNTKVKSIPWNISSDWTMDVKNGKLNMIFSFL